MEFDITHSVKFNLNYYLAARNSNTFFGRLTGDWNFNFQGNLATGAPYTPTDIYGKAKEIGSKRMPGYKSLDMRVEKYLNNLARKGACGHVRVKNLTAMWAHRCSVI